MIRASSITNIVKATDQYVALPTSNIAHVSIDSRSIFDPIDTIYFAIIGPRNNGHRYIDDLYLMGLRHFIVQEVSQVKQYKDINYWKVENTLDAFQLMAKHIRNQVNIPIIGITGSNGKTIVKEWLFHGLKDNEQICRSPKSYNSQVGVPFSVWNLNQQNTLGIFEAGVSQTGEMEKLAQIIRPTIGIFTHLGSAHQNNFKSLKEKANEKIKLFEHAEVIFYPADQTMVDSCLKKAFENNTQLLKGWSSKDKNAWMYVEEKFANDACHCSVTIENQHHHVVIPFTQSASLNNAYACIITWHHLGLSWDVIQQKLNSLPSLGMRLELRKGANNCTIINDAYSLDLDSLQIALDLQHHHNEHKNKWVILSTLPHILDEKQAYAQVASLLSVASVNQLILVGIEYQKNKELFAHLKAVFVNDIIELKDYLKNNQPSNATVLVKGARTFGFEKIVNQLEEFEHQTRLEINLNAIQHNLNMYRSLLKPNTKIMVMVKAFSYGSGAYEIAQWMEFNQVDYLAVAFTNEGVALRKNGIRTPILVLNAEPNSFAQMIEHRLEPEIYNQKSLTAFSEAVCQAAEVEAYPIHLKIETGMNRLGFTAHEIQDVITTIKENSTLKVASVFSHLAGSDEAMHDDFTNQQISSFSTIASNIESELDYPIIKHVANSAAISRFPNAHFDMARLGIGLYGHSGDKQLNDKLEVVAQLKTTITQIKQLNAGETIGYGRNFSVLKPSKIAVIPIGYADGLRRGINLVNGFVMISEKRANYVGNICMDMCMIDVSGINCQEGDEVIIFGHTPSLQDIATWYNTIPYEIISNISQRVKRIYFKD